MLICIYCLCRKEKGKKAEREQVISSTQFSIWVANTCNLNIAVVKPFT